jgi:dienelactone hydrolase
MRELGPGDGLPADARIFFPSLDGAVATAPLLEGCGRYPLVVFAHGHCIGDPRHFERWFHLPSQLARAGYVVAVPQLAGVGGGLHPSSPDHPDLETLASVVGWMRSEWEHADAVDAGPIGVVGHSFGALIGARFAADANVGAFAGLSGVWQDWPTGPLPMTALRTATLLVWGGPLDFFTALPDAIWDAMPPPKHRTVWAEGEHWDYLVGTTPPCSSGAGPCGGAGVATTDMVTLFLGKHLPPQFATNLVDDIPDHLGPPELDLTPEQQFFAGGWLSGFPMLEGEPSCALERTSDPWPLVANKRTKETHSRVAPCGWVRLIAPPNRRFVRARPPGYFWCDHCFPHLADG